MVLLLVAVPGRYRQASWSHAHARIHSQVPFICQFLSFTHKHLQMSTTIYSQTAHAKQIALPPCITQLHVR